VASTPYAGPVNLGFLTILQEGNSFFGGLLVTNIWGRPLEFRLTSAVQPNKVQQILYAATLAPYISGELIGKTLMEKISLPVHLVVTDREAAMDLRLKVNTPVLYLADEGEGIPLPEGRGVLRCHPRFPNDAAVFQGILQSVDQVLDLTEPFSRIREAIAEARRMGVTSKAA
jgi:hypothetical protein